MMKPIHAGQPDLPIGPYQFKDWKTITSWYEHHMEWFRQAEELHKTCPWVGEPFGMLLPLSYLFFYFLILMLFLFIIVFLLRGVLLETHKNTYIRIFA